MTPHPRAIASAILAGVAGLVGSYFVAGTGAGFVGAPIEAAVTRWMPGTVVTLAITELGGLARYLVIATTLAIAVLLFAAAALAAIELGRRSGTVARPAALAGLAGGLLSVGLVGRLLPSIASGIAMFLVVGAAASFRRPHERTFEPARRQLLGLAAGVAGLSVGAYLWRRGRSPFERLPLEVDDATRRDIDAKLDEAAEKSLDRTELEPLVSREFYVVDINPSNKPRVDAEEWSLSMTGAVENRHAVDFDDLRSRAVESRFVTLRCVGDSLNGRQIDTALWTGVPAAPLVDAADPTGGCECVMLRAADGYHEEFPVEALRRGFLAFGMNGEALPIQHGYPVRALIPGHWGEINVKWLTEIEFLDEQVDGYWEKRGWHGTGPVKTVAKLHAVNRLGGGRVQIGGPAYAGLRGISAVEVSTDGGESWIDATLSEPLPGEDVWRQWTHTLEVDGETEVTVRAIEADGTVQPEDETGPFPSGPSGRVTRTI